MSGSAGLDALIAELSAGFVSLPGSEVDQAIGVALRRLRRTAGLEGSGLWRREPGGEARLSATHIDWPDRRQRSALEAMSIEEIPWCWRVLQAGGAVRFTHLDALPAAAEQDRRTWRERGVRAAILMPIAAGPGPPAGMFACFAAPGPRAWPQARAGKLSLIAHVLANALERKASDLWRQVHDARDAAPPRTDHARLQETLEFTRNILASMVDGVAILDRAGVIVALNDAWERHGRAGSIAPSPSGGTVGTNYLRECAMAGKPDVVEGVESVLSGASQLFRTEYEVPSLKDTRWFQLEVMPLRRPGGGAVVLHSDISVRKRTETELRRLRQDIWHAHRVTQTTAIAASLAHELNQPLTAILSNAQAGLKLMGAAEPDLGEIREILGDIVQDDKRAAAVIMGLRAMLRRKETQREPVELKRMVEDVLKLVRNEFLQHRVAVELDFDGDIELSADRAQLQQVILNLVTNAIEAMESQPAARRRLQISLRRSAEGEAVLGFRDHGSGIPADEQPKVFDSFWTTKPSGMGIGLTICRSIIESHGGYLWFEPNDKFGMTFFVSLPLAVPATVATTAR